MGEPITVLCIKFKNKKKEMESGQERMVFTIDHCV